MTLSEMFPHHRKIVDEVCWLQGLTTDVFNHGPAKLFMNTGFPAPGRPAMGAWVTYGLGSESQNLPGFVVLQSGPRGPRGGASLWASGFLPTSFQGVPFREQGRSDLVSQQPRRASPATAEREFYDTVEPAQSRAAGRDGRPRNPHADQRLRNGLSHADQRAGADGSCRRNRKRRSICTASKPGSRRLPRIACSPAGWSSAACASCSFITRTGTATAAPAKTSTNDFEKVCRDVDQASAALVHDLKQRGLLEGHARHLGRRIRPHADGRGPRHDRPRSPHRRLHDVARRRRRQSPASSSAKPTNSASAPSRTSTTSTTSTPRSSTCLGFDHERLTYRFQGRDFRLTDVHGNVIEKMLA